MAHGSLKMRMPAAALGAWDGCALGLAPASTPVVTADGVLFDREAILRCLVDQSAARRAEGLEDALRDVGAVRAEGAERARKELEEKEAFEKAQERVHRTAVVGESVPEVEDPPRVEGNFWLPRAVPPGNVRVGRKKGKGKGLRTRCPISKRPLRSKDLISLAPTPNKSVTGAEAKHRTGRFMCPVCQIALTNAVKPTALRTGSVLCARCVESFVRKEARDPVTSAPVDVQHDIIPIFNSGTAFAASGSTGSASKEGTLYQPSAR